MMGHLWDKWEIARGIAAKIATILPLREASSVGKPGAA